MKRSPKFIHPEMFDAVWKRWSVMCANEEMAGKPVSDARANVLWDIANTFVGCHVRLEWEEFRQAHGLGVYR